MKPVKIFSIIILFTTTAFAQTETNQKMEKNINTKTIVFIHGLFLNNTNWEKWQQFFESKGYTCHAPAYPGHEGAPAELWKNTPEDLGKVNFSEVLSSLESFIDSLPEKPILIGHSMGALLTQKLVEAGKAEAAICISSAPPKGIITTKFSFAKSNLGMINPFKGNLVYYPTKKWFHYAFTNTLSREESDQIFDQYVVPESRNIARESLKKAGKIDFKRPHVPLMFIAGKKDHIVPFTLNRKNFNKYTDKNSIRDFKLYEDRDHYICGQSNWQEVATYVYEWIEE